jgi:predicted nucleic acid-binding protein
MSKAGSVLVDTNVVIAHLRIDPDNDIWIAAVARQYDLPLVTRDGHFTVVPQLRVLAW